MDELDDDLRPIPEPTALATLTLAAPAWSYASRSRNRVAKNDLKRPEPLGPIVVVEYGPQAEGRQRLFEYDPRLAAGVLGRRRRRNGPGPDATSGSRAPTNPASDTETAARSSPR